MEWERARRLGSPPADLCVVCVRGVCGHAFVWARVQILGAFTSVYLLEKPRICNHLNGERNYHIFYMLCKSPKEVREPTGVTKWEEYAICNQKGTIAKVETWNDEGEFADCHTALSNLGFSDQQRGEMVLLVAPAAAQQETDQQLEKLGRLLLEELPLSRAARVLAGWSGRKRNDVYRLLEQWSGKSE